jgi:hypothetical protein
MYLPRSISDVLQEPFVRKRSAEAPVAGALEDQSTDAGELQALIAEVMIERDLFG